MKDPWGVIVIFRQKASGYKRNEVANPGVRQTISWATDEQSRGHWIKTGYFRVQLEI